MSLFSVQLLVRVPHGLGQEVALYMYEAGLTDVSRPGFSVDDLKFKNYPDLWFGYDSFGFFWKYSNNNGALKLIHFDQVLEILKPEDAESLLYYIDVLCQYDNFRTEDG